MNKNTAHQVFSLLSLSPSNDVLDMGLLQRAVEPAREILEVEKVDVVADEGYFRTEDVWSRCSNGRSTHLVLLAARDPNATWAECLNNLKSGNI